MYYSICFWTRTKNHGNIHHHLYAYEKKWREKRGEEKKKKKKKTNEKSRKTNLKSEYINMFMFTYTWPSILWIYLVSAVCARMLTMKHWFRVSFILCRYKARSVHFAYIVSSLGFFFVGFFVIHLFFVSLIYKFIYFCCRHIGRRAASRILLSFIFWCCFLHIYVYFSVLADQHRMKTE